MASKLRWKAGALLVAVSTGCALFGKGGESPPSPFDVTVTAAQRLNPDDGGESLPTLVRLYQLKSAGKLESADFDHMYRVPKETLGDDLLRVDEMLLSPGGTAQQRIERDKAARTLAVVPIVRRPTGKSWRTVVELPPPEKGGRFAFFIEGYRIERHQAPGDRR